MIPHEYKDYRDKKPPPELEPRDYFMIAVMSYVIGTSFIYGDPLTFILGVIGWKIYENNRAKE